MSNEEASFSLKDWEQSTPQVFDREAAYREHVAPLIEQLHQACKAHGIPMFVTACFGQDANGDNRGQSAQFVTDVSELPAELLVRMGEDSLTPNFIMRTMATYEADQRRVKRTNEQLAGVPDGETTH